MASYKKKLDKHRYFNNADILIPVKKNMPNTRQKYGDGSFAKNMAIQLKVSPATIYQVIFILKHASDKILDEVLLDIISIKNAYTYLKNH
jgi:hypothetical protein